jgi:hypothetical protein
MDQDRRSSRQYIVRVELLDGEVVHVGRAGAGGDGEDVGVGVGGGFEGVAWDESAGGDPGTGGVVPEGVPGGGVKGGGGAVGVADGQVDEEIAVPGRVDPSRIIGVRMRDGTWMDNPNYVPRGR